MQRNSSGDTFYFISFMNIIEKRKAKEEEFSFYSTHKILNEIIHNDE